MFKYTGIILRNIKYLVTHPLYAEFEDLKFQIKDEVMDDMVYEYEENRKNYKTIKILDEIETVHLLMTNPKSFVRFSDGEIKLMSGMNQPFQKYDRRLVQKMYRILKEEHTHLYIGLNKNYFQSVSQMPGRGRYYRINGTKFRRFFLEHCSQKNTYIDAAFTMAYFRFNSDYDFKEHYERMMDLFKGRKIAVVSGRGVLEKLEYDVFQRADKKIVIHGPSKHAFRVYDGLLEKICAKVSRDYVVCFVLGMAGKAMIWDLTKRGYMAWDIGHMAKDYDYYMRRVEKNEENEAGFYAPD